MTKSLFVLLKEKKNRQKANRLFQNTFPLFFKENWFIMREIFQQKGVRYAKQFF